MKWLKTEEPYAVSFDFLCKCGEKHRIMKIMNQNYLELMCLVCERKFTIKLYMEEKL